MSLSGNAPQSNGTKQSSLSKSKSLNPNAAVFVPLSLKKVSSLLPGSTDAAAISKFATSGNPGKAVLDRSESSIPNNPDEEASQYWSYQLPDDITPDFKVLGEGGSHEHGVLSLEGLSLHEGYEAMGFSCAKGGGYVLSGQQNLSSPQIGSRLHERMRRSTASCGEDLASSSFLNLPNTCQDKEFVKCTQFQGNNRDEAVYTESSGQVFMNDMLVENVAMNNVAYPLELLSSKFPGFGAKSLAEVYFVSGCDLNLTIEIFTQLELQVDGAFNQNMNTTTFSLPKFNALEFPVLTAPDNQNGLQKYDSDDLQRDGKKNMLMSKTSSSLPSRGTVDFASGVGKMASQNSSAWKYDKYNSSYYSGGSSKGSHVLSGPQDSRYGRSSLVNRLQTRSSTLAAPIWVDTGETVEKLYSELREEAHDHARLLDAYFEQAHQGYLVGNKALAKELMAKGQLHNMQMKAAHEKAQQSIYRHRNPVGSEMGGNGRAQERMIDLHGLHVSEALHILKHELSVLRRTARAAEQCLQVYIFVGTGHHTRGQHTLAGLPVAVQCYLLEDEGLDYSEPQPGLLRVIMY